MTGRIQLASSPVWDQSLGHTSPVPPRPVVREGAGRMAELRWAADSVNTPHSRHGCPRATSRHAHRMDYQEHYTSVHFLTVNTEKGLAGAEDKPSPLPLPCCIREIHSHTSYSSKFKRETSLSFLLSVSC